MAMIPARQTASLWQIIAERMPGLILAKQARITVSLLGLHPPRGQLDQTDDNGHDEVQFTTLTWLVFFCHR